MTVENAVRQMQALAFAEREKWLSQFPLWKRKKRWMLWIAYPEVVREGNWFIYRFPAALVPGHLFPETFEEACDMAISALVTQIRFKI